MGIDRRLRIVGVAWLLSGCAGELDNPEDFEHLLDSGGVNDAASADDDAGDEDVPSCVTETFMDCGTVICHGAGAPQVDLISAGVAARLLDQPSLAGGACADRVFIPTDGETSLLLQKLSTSSDCGSPMPLGRDLDTPFDPAQYDCLEAWVISLGGSALEASP